MGESSLQEQQFARMASLQGKAEHLASVARHWAMQMQVATALRDLAEALMSLHEQDVVHRPLLLQMSQMAVDFAAMRLALVEQALSNYGPDVSEIG